MTQTKIHPVPGFILVQPQKKESTTASGIVLPENNQDKPQQGKVIAIGDTTFIDGREVKSPCNIGDIVIYREWGGKEYKEDNIEFLILKFDDIMAIIK